jgi:acetoacetyl-CoA synthetase
MASAAACTASTSRPRVGSWNDTGDERYHASYFEDYPGVWRHGDWILFTDRGSCVITGRADATLNRGVRTGEFYEVVEELDEVLDSLVVDLEDREGGAGVLLLFVVLRDGAELDDDLWGRIAGALRASCLRATCPTPSTPCRRSQRR